MENLDSTYHPCLFVYVNIYLWASLTIISHHAKIECDITDHFQFEWKQDNLTVVEEQMNQIIELKHASLF